MLIQHSATPLMVLKLPVNYEIIPSVVTIYIKYYTVAKTCLLHAGSDSKVQTSQPGPEHVFAMIVVIN